MRTMISSRRASTTLMFAVFAAVMTLGVMSFSKQVKHTVTAAITKQAPLRY